MRCLKVAMIIEGVARKWIGDKKKEVLGWMVGLFLYNTGS